ncbi:MAG: 16S rRNA (cytosine(1402)-N(4))-methyltransferase RsmH [Candidatus Bipolaricaulota bacterium]|nr:16S rRNA (cytosine(1402)-N(4))-methyltransferase RsmH [Candidatus Bipolaricaulota bacterium]
MADTVHQPVLTAEVLQLLDPRPGGIYVDGTVGLGGHTQALIEAGPGIRVIGIDRDKKALKLAAERLIPFADQVRLIHGNYRDIGVLLSQLKIVQIDGLLIDLGVSSLQLETPPRGFSFRKQGPLDMRMDPSQGITAGYLVNNSTQEKLTTILNSYGEERFARRIARSIVAERAKGPIETTGELAQIVRGAIPRRFQQKRIDPATRTFQALRIAVNHELEDLQTGLPAGFDLLAPGGTMAVISFHSLEDRIVKHFFRDRAHPPTPPPEIPLPPDKRPAEATILTRRPIRPSPGEVARNPRSRSAKLRAARKI